MAEGKKIIAVVGATGQQGGSVARTFAHLPGWRVRGLTRDINSAGARALKKLGVEVVVANLDDVQSLKAAFEGVHAIFGVTDFWAFQGKASTEELVREKVAGSWNEACYLQEVRHGRNIIDAAASQVAVGGQGGGIGGGGILERLVLSTLSDAKRNSQGKYTWVWHFDAKAHFVRYLREQAEREPVYGVLWERTSYVQVGYYLDNWKDNPLSAPQKIADKTYALNVVDREDSNGADSHSNPIPFVHPPTDLGPFVEALVLRAPPRTTLLGTSQTMRMTDWAKLWGKTLGVKVEINHLSVKNLVEMLPEGFGIEIGEMFNYIEEFGWEGGEDVVLPQDIGVDMSALTDVKKYIETTDFSSVDAELGRG